MKKIVALTMALAMVFTLASCGKKDEAPAEGGLATVESGKLIMSTNAQFPPYEMVADDGSLEGIDIEVAGLIADKLGLELQIDDMDFDGSLLAVQNGKSDMVMAGVTADAERDKVMDFTDSYATGVQVVIVKEGSDVTVDNLGEQLIGVQRGTTSNIYCADDFGEDHVVAYDDGAVAVQMLINGQIDCVVIDNAPAKSYVEANADKGLTILDTEYVTENYAIGVDEGNADLQKAINDALAELIADGKVQEVVDKYIPAK